MLALNGKRSFSGAAVDAESGSLDDVLYINGVGHHSAHVVFHRLGVDAIFLKLFRISKFFPIMIQASRPRDNGPELP